MKYWGRSEQIISKTLQLLNDLSVGYSCVRKLVKLEEVQFMLNNHTVSIELYKIKKENYIRKNLMSSSLLTYRENTFHFWEIMLL